MLEDEFPKDRIVAGRFLAPKTYCIAIMKRYNDELNSYQIAYQVRCKVGILSMITYTFHLICIHDYIAYSQFDDSHCLLSLVR